MPWHSVSPMPPTTSLTDPTPPATLASPPTRPANAGVYGYGDTAGMVGEGLLGAAGHSLANFTGVSGISYADVNKSGLGSGIGVAGQSGSGAGVSGTSSSGYGVTG